MSEKVKVLHVDDEVEMLILVKMILDKNKYQIENALNGAEALEKLSQYRPDLVLLDISMPEIDGWEVRRRMKDYEHLKGVPVIIITAKHSSGDALQGLHDLKADAYLTKPFNPSELLSTIKATIG
jgi:DNA-binding response OmpR family regulator